MTFEYGHLRTMKDASMNDSQINDTSNLINKMVPVEFISFERAADFRGFLTDPITDNEVKFMLKRQNNNNNKIKILAGMPEILLYENAKKGITFPKEIEFSKQKDNE